jgi:hypothetical protein
MMKSIACILHRILLGWLNQGEWRWRDMWHAWGRAEYLQGFGLEVRREETTEKT